MRCAIPFFPGGNILQAKIRGQINNADTCIQQGLHLMHRDRIGRGKKYQIAVSISIDIRCTELEIYQTSMDVYVIELLSNPTSLPTPFSIPLVFPLVPSSTPTTRVR